jgi:pimeloyl-ACP methyl ester carboxylesterase
MANIVLIPGSWLGGWVWRRVTPRLREAGHDVYPLTLTAFGDRTHLGGPDTGLSTHVQDIVATLETEELDDVVLVGHSYGGAPATFAADRVPDRIAQLVYVAGVIPVSGVSALDSMPPEAAQGLTAFADSHGGGRTIPLAFDDPVFALYYGDHGVTGEDRRWLEAHAVGQPLATYREALTLENPPPRRTYVRCTADPAPPPVTADTEGWDYMELESGHWPMVTRPAELAELLDSIARGTAHVRQQ